MIAHLVLGLIVQTFSHLSLADAQNAALAHSPDVAAARAKVAEQQANFDAARSTILPALVANYAQTPQLGADNLSSIAQHTTTVGAQVTLGDLFAYSPAVAQASATLSAARSDAANAERVERTNAIALYYGALSATATHHARDVARDGAARDRDAAEIRFKAGDAPRLDVVRASVALAQADADLARAQADDANATAALALEIDVDPATLVTVDVDAGAPDAFTSGVRAATDAALAARPEIGSARENVAAEEHAVALARTGVLPIITASAGYTSGTDTGIKISGPSVNVTATMPLGGSTLNRVAAESARLDQARAQRERLVRAVTLEVGSAVRTYGAQSRAQEAAERALGEALAERDATVIGYRSGATSGLDVEAARTTYVQALVAAITAHYAQKQARATLDLLMGKR
jgi:outer membrane protein TolC